ncbi:MAG: type II toxin-antitoxin system HicA family toxin [Gemmatimonadetes bacterium]|nr:type II toxin-antitoxin system HicA family toxin [Gemmatimonadota bacterium]
MWPASEPTTIWFRQDSRRTLSSFRDAAPTAKWCGVGAELVRRLRRFGYEVDRQTGSHIILRHADPPHRRITVPNHKTIAKGTLRTILRHAQISVEEISRRS